MKKIPSAALALSLFGALLPSAFALGIMGTTPPMNGFVQTAEPEWSTVHETAPSDAPDHRQYHRDAATARTAWLSLHVTERGTLMYTRLHRTMLQARNMMHRKYHLDLQAAYNSSSSANRPVSSFSRSYSSSSSSSSTRSSSSSSSSVSSVSSSSSSSSSVNQASVSLQAASTFAVLAGSTVTNTGPTSISGDVGVSAGTAVTGFGPGLVTNGEIHSADTLSGQAQAALTVAYNDLAGRSTAPVSVAGNLGGMTLAPGLYKSTSGLEISSGDLTLDAKGNSNAIFIFQIASTLNVTSGRQVNLIGGAKASNVFWQVGTSANLGSSSAFKGNVLADQSISLQTSATVEGRLLARIGAVTMQSNTVTVPSN